MFRNLPYVSHTLQTSIDGFIERMDMTQRDRELFYDIVGFAFDEGKIRGKEQVLNGTNLGEETKKTSHE